MYNFNESKSIQLSLYFGEYFVKEPISFSKTQETSGKKKREKWEYEFYVRDVLFSLLPFSEKEKNCHPKRGYVDILTVSSIVETKSAKQGSLGIDQLIRYKERFFEKSVILYLINCGNKEKAPKINGERPARTQETENEKEIERIVSHLDFEVLILKERYGFEIEDRRRNIEKIRQMDIEYLASQYGENPEHYRNIIREYLSGCEKIKAT